MKKTIKDIISILELDKKKAQTIRNYSDKFNIGKKDPSNGYRLYSNDDIEKLKKLLNIKNKKNEIEDINNENEIKVFEPSKNDLDLISLRTIIKDEIEGFVNLSKSAIISAQEVGKLRAINEFQSQEIETLKEKILNLGILMCNCDKIFI